MKCRSPSIKQRKTTFQHFFANLKTTQIQKNHSIAFQNNGFLIFPAWLRNRLITAGLEPVLIHTKKLCITSYFRQFSTIIKIKILNFDTSFVSLDLRPLGAYKTRSNLIIFHFTIRGNLSIKRCYKQLQPFLFSIPHLHLFLLHE